MVLQLFRGVKGLNASTLQFYHSYFSRIRECFFRKEFLSYKSNLRVMCTVKKSPPSIGDVIRTARRSRGLPLTAVARQGYLALSTISAVERGRRIPSVSVLDSITHGFGEAVGAFDLAYLASANDVSQREEVYRRLTAQPNPQLLLIQGILRSQCSPLQIDESRPLFRHDRHLRLLLADIAMRRQQWRRAIVLIRRAVLPIGSLEPEFAARALSLLGKCHLYVKCPDEALAALLEACRLTQGGEDWESAMVNLGLAWWELGRYDRARAQWTEAMDTITNEERRSHAIMGLGNVALRTGQLEAASCYFREAFERYQVKEGTRDLQARALNNLLISAVRLQNQETGTWAFETGLALVDAVQNSILRGELYETLAEWAVASGDIKYGTQLLSRAKEELACEPVLSWFSARFLEICTLSRDTGQVSQRLHEMDTMVRRVRDPQLVAAIRLRMAQAAMEFDVQPTANVLLKACRTLFPPIGGAIETHGQDKSDC